MDIKQPDLFGADEAREEIRQDYARRKRMSAANKAKETRGMARTVDRPTSIKAAREVQRRSGTIREAVENFFALRGPMGATDDEVRRHFGDEKPESSYRKRRTELAQDGIILDTGKERGNRFGVKSTVWVHRDHAGPGAKKVEPVETKRSQREAILAAAVRAGIDELVRLRERYGAAHSEVVIERMQAALNGVEK